MRWLPMSLLLLVACTTSYDADLRARQEREVRAFMENLQRARCAQAIRCETVESWAWHGPAASSQPESCHPQGRELTYTFDDVHYDFERWLRGANEFRPDAAARCLRRLEADCVGDGTDVHPCQAVFVGDREEGEPCLERDCGPELYCRFSPETQCPGQCVRRSALGERCEASPCRVGLNCRGEPGDKRCVEPSAIGEPCSNGCISRHCDAGLCVRAPSSGDPCTGSICPGDNTRCARPAMDTDGICVTGASAGEACAIDRPCAAGHRCVGATCRRVAMPGEECSPEVCPVSFYCDGVCKPEPTLGEACGPTVRCGRGECVDGVCTARFEPGAACDWPDPRSLGSCNSGYCGGAIGCRIEVPDGERCDDGEEVHCENEFSGCRDGVCKSLFCDLPVL